MTFHLLVKPLLVRLRGKFFAYITREKDRQSSSNMWLWNGFSLNLGKLGYINAPHINAKWNKLILMKYSFPERLQSRRIYKRSICEWTFCLSSCLQLGERESVAAFTRMHWLHVSTFARSIGYNCIYVDLSASVPVLLCIISVYIVWLTYSLVVGFYGVVGTMLLS